jgi:hypothetical protein
VAGNGLVNPHRNLPHDSKSQGHCHIRNHLGDCQLRHYLLDARHVQQLVLLYIPGIRWDKRLRWSVDFDDNQEFFKQAGEAKTWRVHKVAKGEWSKMLYPDPESDGDRVIDAERVPLLRRIRDQVPSAE